MEALRALASESKGILANAAENVVAKGRDVMGRAKVFVGIAEDDEEAVLPPEPSFMDELNQSCSLTYKQRLYGFASCLGLGLFCSLLSFLVFFHPIKFAISYSFANVLAIGSTGFLIGFWRQLELMFHPIRAVSAVVYVVAIICTLLAAFWVHDGLLTLLCIIIQQSALLWYSLSYIPFAQAAATKLFRRFLQSET